MARKRTYRKNKRTLKRRSMRMRSKRSKKTSPNY